MPDEQDLPAPEIPQSAPQDAWANMLRGMLPQQQQQANTAVPQQANSVLPMDYMQLFQQAQQEYKRKSDRLESLANVSQNSKQYLPAWLKPGGGFELSAPDEQGQLGLKDNNGPSKKQKLGSVLGEILRFGTNPLGYMGIQDPWSRAKHAAISQYQREAPNLEKELADQKGLMGSLAGVQEKAYQLQVQEARRREHEQNLASYRRGLLSAKDKDQFIRQHAIDAHIPLWQAQAEAQEALSDLRGAQTENVENKNNFIDQTGLPGGNAQTAALIGQKSSQDQNSIFNAMLKTGVAQHPYQGGPTVSSHSSQDIINAGGMKSGSSTSSSSQKQMNPLLQQFGISPGMLSASGPAKQTPQVVNGMPVPNITQPKSPAGTQFQQGVKPTTDEEIMNPYSFSGGMPVKKPNDVSLRNYKNAADAYIFAEQAKRMITEGKVPTGGFLNSLTHGEYSKWIQGTKWGTPELQNFLDSMKIVAQRHTGTTNVRSAEFIQDLEKYMMNTGRNKDSILRLIDNFQEGALSAVRGRTTRVTAKPEVQGILEGSGDPEISNNVLKHLARIFYRPQYDSEQTAKQMGMTNQNNAVPKIGGTFNGKKVMKVEEVK